MDCFPKTNMIKNTSPPAFGSSCVWWMLPSPAVSFGQSEDENAGPGPPWQEKLTPLGTRCLQRIDLSRGYLCLSLVPPIVCVAGHTCPRVLLRLVSIWATLSNPEEWGVNLNQWRMSRRILFPLPMPGYSKAELKGEKRLCSIFYMNGLFVYNTCPESFVFLQQWLQFRQF